MQYCHCWDSFLITTVIYDAFDEQTKIELYVIDKVGFSEVGKDVHEESSNGTSVKGCIRERSCNGLHASSRSEICL